MRIGQVAKQLGCQVETLRYYEAEGLLPVPARSAAGYRIYRPEHVEQLQFILHCRSLDLSLSEIRQLLALRNDPDTACAEVNHMIDQRLIQIRNKINSLRKLEDQIVALRQTCSNLQTVEPCGILETLTAAAEGQDCPCHHTQSVSSEISG